MPILWIISGCFEKDRNNPISDEYWRRVHPHCRSPLTLLDQQTHDHCDGNLHNCNDGLVDYDR